MSNRPRGPHLTPKVVNNGHRFVYLISLKNQADNRTRPVEIFVSRAESSRWGGLFHTTVQTGECTYGLSMNGLRLSYDDGVRVRSKKVLLIADGPTAAALLFPVRAGQVPAVRSDTSHGGLIEGRVTAVNAIPCQR
ncbi:hypothetical protein [Paraburkholderia domus]|uniref:hypothetical protein n=1 Tax=Paraburkholderia domus TaxID=2793075 RepID=UPI001B28BB78|nr:hypothetical protein [Paraburkholderia domus]CAE6826230.1 hypothetical protein R75483_06491 [Paraburkholderia domus]